MKTKTVIRRIAAILLLLLAAGCVKVKDELTLHDDGSGTVAVEVKTGVSPEMMGGDFRGMMGMGASGVAPYPPLSQAMAEELFPAKDFIVTTKSASATNGPGQTLTIKAQFKDINALLNSPYGKAHSLTIKKEGGKLQVKALSGMQLVAAMSENKDSMRGYGAQFQQMGVKPEDLYVEFRLTLPNAITAGNGQNEGKTAVWIVDRSKIKEGSEAVEQIGKPMEAVCVADGLKFEPVTPLRLDLDTFQNVTEAALGVKGQAPDTNKVLAATKFLPQMLQTSRSIDLSGEGGGGMHSANLTGFLTLPKDLAPSKMGECKLLEVTDDAGKDLRAQADDEGRGMMMQNSIQMMNGNVDDEDEETNKGKPGEQRYSVSFGFKAPEWKVREISRIRATASLQYFGASQVIKVENAIHKIMNPEGMDSYEPPQMISSASLKQLGLELTPENAMYQQGITIVSLQSKGSKATIKEIQAFDADGKAWPTISGNAGFTGQPGVEQIQVMIPGKPKPPLSLAMIVSADATTVLVPIELDHIPLTNPAK